MKNIWVFIMLLVHFIGLGQLNTGPVVWNSSIEKLNEKCLNKNVEDKSRYDKNRKFAKV